VIVGQTKRLLISEFTLEDAAFFLQLANSPGWLIYIGDRNLRTVKDAETYLKNGSLKSYSEVGFGFYKLQLKESLQPIGTCGLVKREELEHVDIGFALLPQFEGFGFGFESSLAILNLAKQKFKIDKVAAITVPHNNNSIQLIEKLGMTFEKKITPFKDDVELLLFVKELN